MQGKTDRPAFDYDAIMQSLKPQESFISRRPITKTLATPEMKLYTITITDGVHFVTYLIKRESRILAEGAAKKLVETKVGYNTYGVNLVDSDRLDAGEIVHIF